MYAAARLRVTGQNMRLHGPGTVSQDGHARIKLNLCIELPSALRSRAVLEQTQEQTHTLTDKMHTFICTRTDFR